MKVNKPQSYFKSVLDAIFLIILIFTRILLANLKQIKFLKESKSQRFPRYITSEMPMFYLFINFTPAFISICKSFCSGGMGQEYL